MDAENCELDSPTDSPHWAMSTIENAEVALRALCMALASVGLLVNAAVLCALFCGGGRSDSGDDKGENSGAAAGSGKRRRRRRAPWLWAMLGSLCVADVLLAASTIALLAFAEHERKAEHAAHASAGADGTESAARRARDEYCAIQSLQYIWDMATTANLLTLVAIAAHLFAAARCPLACGSGGGGRCCLGRPKLAAAATLVAIWLTSAAGALLPAAMVATSVRHDQLARWPSKTSSRFCYQLILYAQLNGTADAVGDSVRYKYDFGQQSHERTHLLLGLTLTCAALLAVVGAYAYVLRAVRRSSTGGSGGGSWRRLAVVAAVVTLLFLACYLPLYTLHALASFYDWHVSAGEYGGVVYAVLMAAVALAPIVDPLLYALRVREIRTALTNLFAPHRLLRRGRRDRLTSAVVDDTVGSFVAMECGRESRDSCVSGVLAATTAQHSRL